ncbi:hypothetical protein PTSG_01161 [Salpingoeca rosetta]|uniref:MATE efflux family protein n=1 Tax=Salpingoeca rosetta (strain ATCC 50818 / BSB-021) TaxID=946362 RepID=F2U0Z5_SALR5|nr:uncharacterized protein PTSG_01161 [Salpingoeca rosetta]EGD80569.1 hypothetical protein PTSG_01161 [Salpingoeca rosetta]|eukprot:XP_004997130.1 hypothetical protein PTSG_01161 [Salpingoeca rosetta]
MADDEERQRLLQPNNDDGDGDDDAGDDGGGGFVASASVNASKADVEKQRSGGDDGGGNGNGNGDDDNGESWSVAGETRTILLLSLPIFVAVCSWVGMKVTDTAVLGHVGTDYLSAASLSDIYTTATAFLIGGRVLSTFCGQAWGAKNYRLVGIWLNVSLVIVGLFAIPVIISWNLTTYVLEAFHKTGPINRNASLYSGILSASIPAQVTFTQVSSYFQAQQIVRPGVVVAVISFAYNLLMNIFLVLGVGIKGFSGVGFIGCPLVTASAQWLQAFLLIGIYILWKKLHRPTWFGFHWHEVTWKRCKRYLALYLPAILMYGSEFWRMDLIGVLAASLGDTDVAAFNASYKIIYIVHQFSVAIGQATSIRTGIHLGAAQGKRAFYATWMGTLLAGITSFSLATLVFFIPKQIGSIFTADETVLDLFYDIRLFLAITIFTMSISDTMEAIMVAQGRTRAVAISTTIASWGVHVPASFLLVHYWERSMRGLYLGVALGYSALTLICVGVIMASKWDKLVVEALARSEAKKHVNTDGGGGGGVEGEDEDRVTVQGAINGYGDDDDDDDDDEWEERRPLLRSDDSQVQDIGAVSPAAASRISVSIEGSA